MRAVFLLFISMLHVSIVLTLNTYSRSIRDLSTILPTTFSNDAALWAAYNASYSDPITGKYISCAGTYFLQGSVYSVYRRYDNLPSHSSVYITFKLMIIDYWSTADKLRVEIGNDIHIAHFFNIDANYDETKYSEKSCGDTSSYDLSVTVLVQAPHTGPLLQLGFVRPDLDSSYFGIRDVIILLSTSTVSTPSLCGVSYPGNLLYSPDLNCVCPLGQYWNTAAKQCRPCNSACLNCFGPSASECYSCSKEYSYDGTNCISCTTECFSCSGGYVQPDTTCAKACVTPYSYYRKINIDYCNPPCPSTQYYSLLTRSCINDCTYPLISRFENGNGFCESPCPANAYLLANRTCVTSCLSPNKEAIINGYKSCVIASRSSIMEGAQEVIAVTTSFTTAGLQATTVASSGSPGGMSIGVIQKMFSYIKFINISYSPELQEALATWKSSFVSFDFAPELPDDIHDESLDQYIPQIFVKYDVTSNFLLNFWDNLFSISVILVIVGTFRLIEWISLKKKMKYLPHYLFYRLRIISQNYFLSETYGNFGDVLLFSILQFEAVDVNSGYSLLNLSLCIACTIVIIIGIILHAKLLLKYRQLKKKGDIANDYSELDEFKTSYEGFQMLYRDFKDQELSQQAFLLYFTCRDIIFSFILTFLTDHPIVQICLVVLLSVSMVIYLVIKKPFDDIVDQIQQIFCEIVILIMNGSVLVLEMTDIVDPDAFDIRVQVGDLITITNVFFGFATLAFVGIKFYQLGRLFVREFKLYWNRRQRGRRIRLRQNMANPISNVNNNLESSVDQQSFESPEKSKSFLLNKLDNIFKPREKLDAS